MSHDNASHVSATSADALVASKCVPQELSQIARVQYQRWFRSAPPNTRIEAIVDKVKNMVI
jgi:hypothetical protein